MCCNDQTLRYLRKRDNRRLFTAQSDSCFQKYSKNEKHKNKSQIRKNQEYLLIDERISIMADMLKNTEITLALNTVFSEITARCYQCIAVDKWFNTDHGCSRKSDCTFCIEMDIITRSCECKKLPNCFYADHKTYFECLKKKKVYARLEEEAKTLQRNSDALIQMRRNTREVYKAGINRMIWISFDTFSKVSTNHKDRDRSLYSGHIINFSILIPDIHINGNRISCSVKTWKYILQNIMPLLFSNISEKWNIDFSSFKTHRVNAAINYVNTLQFPNNISSYNKNMLSIGIIKYCEPSIIEKIYKSLLQKYGRKSRLNHLRLSLNRNGIYICNDIYRYIYYNFMDDTFDSIEYKY